jgi:molecular chaperone DnaJ
LGFDHDFNRGGGWRWQVFATSSRIFSAAGAKEREPPRPQPKRGADIEMPLALSFEEAIKGLTTNITVNRSEQCSRCNGAGDIGGPVMVCADLQRFGPGATRRRPFAFRAGVSGLRRHRTRRSPCSLCKGKGHGAETETVKVRIPAGVETGSRVRIPGKGEGGRSAHPPGDLHIITNVGTAQILHAQGRQYLRHGSDHRA